MPESLFDYNVLHIPKTAGQRFRRLCSQVKLPRLNWVGGFGEGAHPAYYLVKDKVPDLPTLFLTRDPVSWFESWFWYHMPPNDLERSHPEFTPDPLFEVISQYGVLEINAAVARLYALLDNGSLADLVSTEIRKRITHDHRMGKYARLGQTGLSKPYAVVFHPATVIKTPEHAYMFQASGLGLYNWTLALLAAPDLVAVVEGASLDTTNRIWFDSADFDALVVPWLQSVYPKARWVSYTPDVLNTTVKPIALTAESVALIQTREAARSIL